MHITRSVFFVNFLGTYIPLASLYNPSTHRLRLLCYQILITVYLRESTGIQPVPAKTVDSFFFPSPSLLSDVNVVNVDQSKYRRTEGTSREMERWVHRLVYSTPAAARHGIIMSWTNKENEGGRTCKVTKYRMMRWRVNEIKEGYPT